MWLREERKLRQGFLVPAGGVVSSPALHATGATSRAWIACVRGVFKATVESSTAAVAVIDVNGAHPRMETTWVVAQVSTPTIPQRLPLVNTISRKPTLSHSNECSFAASYLARQLASLPLSFSAASLCGEARSAELCYRHAYTNRFCRVGGPPVCVANRAPDAARARQQPDMRVSQCNVKPTLETPHSLWPARLQQRLWVVLVDQSL